MRKNLSTPVFVGAMTCRQQCDSQALLALCLRLAKHCGMESVNGLPIEDWFSRQRAAIINHQANCIREKLPEVAKELVESLSPEDFVV